MRLLIFVLCFSVNSILAQKRKFFDALAETPLILYPESSNSFEKNLDVIRFDSIRASSSFLLSIRNHRYRIAKTPFEQDSIYNKICATVLNSLNNSIYINSKVWFKKRRYIYKALTQLRSNYRFYHAFAFTIRLVKYSFGPYYYDKDDTESELRLVYGKKHRNNKRIENGESLDYIQPFTEKEFDAIIVKRVIRLLGKSNFKLSYYDRIGFAIKLNRRTINRRAIPEAKVVVMLGGKVMQKIRL